MAKRITTHYIHDIFPCVNCLGLMNIGDFQKSSTLYKFMVLHANADV